MKRRTTAKRLLPTYWAFCQLNIFNNNRGICAMWRCKCPDFLQIFVILVMLRKYRYNSSLKRPTIMWKSVAFRIARCIAVSALMTLITYHIAVHYGLLAEVHHFLIFVQFLLSIPIEHVEIRLFAFYLLLLTLIHLKQILLFLVRLYQCYAPDSMRLSCRFTPSCSEYMILSIEKYGVLKGVAKGVNRISRCHAPNGGVDYP